MTVKQKRERDVAIRLDLRRLGVEKVAAAYGLSRSQVYRIARVKR